jgi:Glyoxalase-like domain
MTRFALTSTVLGTPDPRGLALFYQRLLASLQGPALSLRSVGGREVLQLSFQREETQVAPVWPAGPDDQHMQMHLDIEVDDLASACAEAVAAGAVLAEFQPQDHVRVLIDPAGHPFCLWVRP